MSTRLQVLMNEAEFEDVRRCASEQDLTVAEWVRQALREARRSVPRQNRKKKIDAVRIAARCTFPTADIAQMLDEIEKGYLQDGTP